MMSVARSGSKQWVLQRVSNLAIVIYSALLMFLLASSNIGEFASFSAIFDPMWFKVVTSVCMVAFAFNGVIAGWQIAGDYVKVPLINKLFNTVCIIASLGALVFSLLFLWG